MDVKFRNSKMQKRFESEMKTEAKIRFPHGRENIEAYSLFEDIAVPRGYTVRKAFPLPSAEGGPR